MASAEREPITGVWARSIQRDTYRVRDPGQGVREAKPPPEAESILSFRSANGAQMCPFLLLCELLKYAFERILLHLAVSLQTSVSTHGVVLSPVECQIRVKHGALFASLILGSVHMTRVIHNVSQRRQRKEDWVMVIGNMQIKLGEVWTCA